MLDDIYLAGAGKGAGPDQMKENALEPFKNFFNPDTIGEMAQYFKARYPAFDVAGFVSFCIDGIEERALKERSHRIVRGLELFLPDDFSASAEILMSCLDQDVDRDVDAAQKIPATNGIRGWAIMPMADYVAVRGQGDVDLAMKVLQQLTMRWSAEFGIRPFLRDQPEAALEILAGWVRHENAHVRRLVSEGTRPLLPWGIRLHRFVENPGPVLELLENLRDDKSEYVRRSVANNLNDISKSHPDLVVQVARRWMRDAPDARQRLVRHGLRTLIKKGHGGALEVLGYGPVTVAQCNFKVETNQVILGDELVFELEFSLAGKAAQPLILDFIIHHRLANGKTSPKVFKWKVFTLGSGKTARYTKRHRIKPITTRRYYGGVHRVEIVLNGAVICGQDFELVV